MGVSIAVHSFKGGTGKSTITSNVAVSLAIRGWRVGVMDMDLEGPGLHVIFNIDPADVQATLNDVLMGSANPGQAVIRLNDKLGLKTGELYFMPASTKPRQASSPRLQHDPSRSKRSRRFQVCKETRDKTWSGCSRIASVL